VRAKELHHLIYLCQREIDDEPERNKKIEVLALEQDELQKEELTKRIL